MNSNNNTNNNTSTLYFRNDIDNNFSANILYENYISNMFICISFVFDEILLNKDIFHYINIKEHYKYYSKEIFFLHGLLDLNKYKIKNGFNTFDYFYENESIYQSEDFKDTVNLKVVFELITCNFIDILQYRLLISHNYNLLESLLKSYYLFILSYGAGCNRLLLIHNIFIPTLNLLITKEHVEEYNFYISLLQKYNLYKFIKLYTPKKH
ncbi:hypothetical protein BCR36DRAFT_367558 [Piromyces finnis]|uniref:Uncharacterized protein n=1 Tax=Piromyces finnis TaxID=1754191 RepID=A0A1Y1VHS9_9FUNG|nr:hypothetical protein BCR36DRAFT_367558 [Piromyces finnis]|eukprot:ORX56589.1 hypothetical protein BCR36DRAFT_367558 [Piromyces finnis]